jgi:hypothetical protein
MEGENYVEQIVATVGCIISVVLRVNVNRELCPSAGGAVEELDIHLSCANEERVKELT